MTIDEAISRMEIFVRDASEVAPELLDDAIRLGIEALKRVKECGYPARCGLMEILPGETNS